MKLILYFFILMIVMINPVSSEAIKESSPTAALSKEKANMNEEAEKILQKVNALLDTRNAESEFKMDVYRDNQLKTTYVIKMQYQDWNHLIATTTEPSRFKGDKMLRSGDNTWVYKNNIKRTVRVSERDGFSNSDFSNVDIMRSDLSSEYKPTDIKTVTENGVKAYELELVAKSDSASYGKIIYSIRKSDNYPLGRKYFTHSGLLIKQMTMQHDSSVLGKRPDVYEMRSEIEKNKKTILRYTQYTAGKKYTADNFSESTLLKQH